MFAKLTALVGGGSTFPYNVNEEYPISWGVWSHHKGTQQSDESNVSIFRVAAADTMDPKLVAARNGMKRLRTLRHPNVLAYKDSMEIVEKGLTVVYLVTEPVKPLKVALDELDLQPNQRDEYLAMGLLHVTKAISFLNNDCKMLHGNICTDAVVVTETLDWKLHGFDLLSEHSLPGDFGLKQHQWMIQNQYKPAELGKNEWDAIRQSPPWAVDAWGLGCLMQEVFSGQPFTQMEQLRNTSHLPKALLGDYQKLLSSAPSRRLDPSKVAESTFLNNRLVEAVKFMENITLKDEVDKESFFRKLPNMLPAIPGPVATRKVLPLLTNALEFGGAPPIAISSLLLIGKSVDSEVFNGRVVPCLSKMFASPDRAVRKSLLETLDQYGQNLTQPVVEEQIYPHLQTGFSDNMPYIRELTLKSMVVLAPKMTNKTLTQSVLKHLSKLQVDEEASIRANTTVLLGSISPHLGEATCKRVLINAFTRALKDVFPPARIAAMRAMTATMQYYSPEDIAARIVPTIAPLAIDTVGDVRQACLQCLATLLKALEQNDAQLRKDVTTPGGAPVSAPADTSGTIAGGAGSMLNWAVSSLMSSSTPQKPKPTPPSAPHPTSDPHVSRNASSSSISSLTSASSHQRPGGPTPASPPAASPSHADRAGSGASASTKDGWDDDEDFMVDEEEVAARSRLGVLSVRGGAPPAGKKPLAAASSTSSHLSAKAIPKADGWDMDGDGDQWDDLDATPAPAPSPAPTPVVRPSASASTTRPRPARPARDSSTGGAGAKKLGAMKLGAQKLGAQKLETKEDW